MTTSMPRHELGFLGSRSRRRRGRRLLLEGLEGRVLLTAQATAVSVAVSNPALYYGASETLTATISVPSGDTAPSEGTATFYDGTTPLGSAPVSQGTASLTLTSLGVGSHSITASYQGDANYASSTSGAQANSAQSTVPVAGLSFPGGIAVDGQGDVFIADSNANEVVELSANGKYSVIASGLSNPLGLAVDNAGDVFVVVNGSSQVVEVPFPYDTTPQTIVSGLSDPFAVAVNGAGNEVFVTDGFSDSVIEVTSGHETTVASGLHFPDGVAVDGAGDVFVAEAGSSDVVKIASGVQTTVSSDLSVPAGLAVDAQGDVFIADDGNSRVVKVTPTGSQITIGTMLADPEAVAVDSSGDVFIADTDNDRAVEVPAGVPVTVNQDPTSTDVVASSAALTFGQSETFTATISVPSGSTAPSSGTVEFKDGTSVIGTAPVTAGVATFATSALAGGSHDIIALFSGATGYEASVSGVEPTSTQFILPITGLDQPIGVAVDSTGDVFVVDSQHDRLVELPESGPQTTYASGLSYPQGVAVDAAGDVFVTEPYDNQVIEIAPSKTQTPIGSGLNFPYGVAVDSQGDVFIADTNSDQIFEVNSNNTQTTVATVTTEVLGVAVDGSGDLFLGEFEAGEVLKLTPSGTETTVGSGLRYPVNMAVDAAGDVFIAEANEDQVVEVTPSGVQMTVGSGLAQPSGVAVDAAGDVFIAETATNQVLEVTPGVPITVNPATPALTWAAPATITYGKALSAQQLDASANVHGSFTYSPPLGTLLHAGPDQALSVTFTPTDATDYTTATATVSINVDQATPTVSWPIPGEITYGTALSAQQLDATASVPGTFQYSPPLGTLLHAGQAQTLSVTFTPTDATDYAMATATVLIDVDQATPTVSWPIPGEITYGTALSALQLDATDSVAGTFTYSPSLGTILHAAPAQTLSVIFKPTDATDYTTATATVLINVDQATSTVNWPTPGDITYGTALSSQQLDATANVPGTFTYSPPLGTILHAGPAQALDVIFKPTDATDYTTATGTVLISVDQATPTVSWPTPGAITYGTALSAEQLDATASVPGTFTYSPPLGTILRAGLDQTLSVTFTPTDAIDYSTVNATTTINVAAQPVTIISEQALFQRKLKHGKPAGKPMLVGYMIDFSGKLNASSAELATNYQVDALSTKKVKKKNVTSLQPLNGFTVSYNDASESVSLVFTSQQKFKTGGQLTVLSGPSSGVTSLSGAYLSGSRELAIAPSGSRISLV